MVIVLVWLVGCILPQLMLPIIRSFQRRYECDVLLLSSAL